MHITIKHTADAKMIAEIASVIDMDRPPLAMPEHIKIGAYGTNCGGGHDYKIMSYNNQVDEYSIWLEEQVQGGNTEVMQALENIFTKAQTKGGVILCTICCPSPYFTHAHVVKQMIERIAGEPIPEENSDVGGATTG